MGDWLGLIIAVAIGVPLLAIAVGVDWWARRRREGNLNQAPSRGDAVVDSLEPSYVSQSEIDALPEPTWAQELRDAHVLIVGDEIHTFRELITPLATWSPLVIAARRFHKDVKATLVANRKAAEYKVDFVELSQAELDRLHGIVSGTVLESADLQAGYVPSDALGFASTWKRAGSKFEVEA